ncbi:carboxymuconolactone decarboxylase family protein [Muricauda sp. CAU 1633]|nr:carboxymuconolactone decarboxylase family protein [Muricauda sp. CAU 1633]
METLVIPTREDVSVENQAVFANLEKAIGFMPNLFAVLANSPTALGDYLSFEGRKSSLNNKEKEVVKLIVSQLNGCDYCLAAHTGAAQMVGFTKEQTIEIRKGAISFDAKLDALVLFAKEVVEQKGDVSEETKFKFFSEGYDAESLIDVLLIIGEKVISNYLFALTKVPVDFPAAEEI